MMRSLCLCLFLAAGVAAYFGPSPRVPPQRFESATNLKFPPLNINKPYGIENEYQLNLGKAIDTLGRDYPHMLHAAPDFSIFSENVVLSSAGKKYTVEGMERYMRVYDVLRFIRNTTMVDDEVGARITVSDGTIRVRWTAKLAMTAPFAALPGLSTRDESGRPVVFVDGVSAYELNATGFVYRHRLENVVVTPPELQGAVDLALFSWPGGFSPPVAATFLPTVGKPARLDIRRMDALAISGGRAAATAGVAVALPADVKASALPAEHVRIDASAVVATAGAVEKARAGAGPRARAPVATAAETPMERAARERQEDAEAAQRLRELRSPQAAASDGKQRGSFFSNIFSAMPDTSPPQSCESNYDCESPLVCCDLVFASICCSSGMMIGPPRREPQLQRQAIPIPVEAGDAPPRDGRYARGNGYPTPP